MPRDLSSDEARQVYKAYFDDTLKPAAIGHSRRNPDDPRTGSDMLADIGDDQVARAVADTVFRDGPDGIATVQRALGEKNPDGKYGSGVHGTLKSVITDGATKQDFLERLKAERLERYPDETNRIEYYTR